MAEIYLNREDLDKWNIESLRDLKRELHWTIQAKENQQKIPVWQIEGYSGVSHAYLDFEKALKYVQEHTEEEYRKGLKSFVSEGYPSYIKLSGHAPRIVPVMMLPEDLKMQDKYFILDLEEGNESN